MTAEAAGLFLDYSKNLLTDESLGLLLDLAHAANLPRPYRRDVPRRQD